MDPARSEHKHQIKRPPNPIHDGKGEKYSPNQNELKERGQESKQVQGES